jgi:hypothetical protein
MKIIVAIAVATLALVAALILPRRLWIGVSMDDGRPDRVGKYFLFRRCKSEVEKVGGWCGQGCKGYGDIFSDCKSIVLLPKAGSK